MTTLHIPTRHTDGPAMRGALRADAAPVAALGDCARAQPMCGLFDRAAAWAFGTDTIANRQRNGGCNGRRVIDTIAGTCTHHVAITQPHPDRTPSAQAQGHGHTVKAAQATRARVRANTKAQTLVSDTDTGPDTGPDNTRAHSATRTLRATPKPDAAAPIGETTGDTTLCRRHTEGRMMPCPVPISLVPISLVPTSLFPTSLFQKNPPRRADLPRAPRVPGAARAPFMPRAPRVPKMPHAHLKPRAPLRPTAATPNSRGHHA
jgi:hypothetical protein